MREFRVAKSIIMAKIIFCNPSMISLFADSQSNSDDVESITVAEFVFEFGHLFMHDSTCILTYFGIRMWP